jgi:hypothetical protein
MYFGHVTLLCLNMVISGLKDTAAVLASFLLNYDPNSLKVVKLANEAEPRHREAWAGALAVRMPEGGALTVRIRFFLYNPLICCQLTLQRYCKHSTKIVKVVTGKGSKACEKVD